MHWGWMIVVAISAVGCSSSDDHVNVPPNTLGKGCSGPSDCTNPKEAYCSASELVCTKTCEKHQDCGCSEGTTAGDITEGKCKYSCVTGSSGSDGYCLRVCTSNGDCEGKQTCQDILTSHLYKVCLSP